MCWFSLRALRSDFCGDTDGCPLTLSQIQICCYDPLFAMMTFVRSANGRKMIVSYCTKVTGSVSERAWPCWSVCTPPRSPLRDQLPHGSRVSRTDSIQSYTQVTYPITQTCCYHVFERVLEPGPLISRDLLCSGARMSLSNCHCAVPSAKLCYLTF